MPPTPPILFTLTGTQWLYQSKKAGQPALQFEVFAGKTGILLTSPHTHTHSRCDQLIEVNRQSLLNQPVEEVQAVLSSLPSGEVRVRVVRPRDMDTVESVLQNQEEQRMISPTSFRCVCLSVC